MLGVAVLYFGLLLVLGSVGSVGMLVMGVAALSASRREWAKEYVRAAGIGAIAVAGPLVAIVGIVGNAPEGILVAAWCLAGAGVGFIVLRLRREVRSLPL